MEQVARISAREAFEDARAAVVLRRRGEAQLIRALCDLAACYRVNEHDLVAPLVEQFVELGGEGTPTVSEFLRLEVQGLLGCSAPAAAGHLRDAIDLKFRHPRLYEAVQELTLDAPRALRVARRCHDLSPQACDTVSARWLPRQAGLSWTAAFNLLERLIIVADARLAAEKERRAREDRGVWTWGLYEGMLNLTGKLDVLDARFLDERLGQLARLLAVRFPELNYQQRRAKAIAVLASPAHALAILQQADQCELPVGESWMSGQTPASVPPCADREPVEEESGSPPAPDDERGTAEPPWALDGSDPPGPPGLPVAWLDSISGAPPRAVRPSADDGDRPSATVGQGAGAPGRGQRAASVPTGPPALTPELLARLRPSLGLAVHIHADALGNLTGDARVERAGHITASLLGELLRDGDVAVSVHPVIDLPNLAPVDRYVPGPVIRRAVGLVFPVEPFPFSTRRAAGLDLDHTVAYRAGRRGQTRLGNLAPLSRSVHRAKTAGHWRVEQPEPGRMVWVSPLGYRYEVTESGTLTVPSEPRSPSRLPRADAADLPATGRDRGRGPVPSGSALRPPGSPPRSRPPRQPAPA